MQGKPRVQALLIFDGFDEGFWRSVTQAGVALAIGLVMWLVCHYGIRLFVKRASIQRTPLNHASLRWAAPMLRNMDPMMRALDNERRVLRARTIGSLLNSILTATVALVTGFYILLAFNINIAPLLASVGVVGIAIGFGCQQLIRDFLAGIFITFEDQYGIGDVIVTSEVVGTVEYLGLRITRVLAEDGTVWYLRNGEILRLGNRSKGNYVPPQPDAPEPQAPQAPAASTPASNVPTSNEPAETAE